MVLGELLDTYVAVLIGAIVGFILVATALIANLILAPKYATAPKETPYECGMMPIGRNVTNFPWAVTFADIGVFAFWEMLIFVAILAAGLGYAWKKGVLSWRGA
jgi:NADH-quinone oxidoreductase subunit A